MDSAAIRWLKKEVGRQAASRVQSGSVVGLGTGSTACHAIAFLGQRLRGGDLHSIRGIPTSLHSARLARECGIPLTTVDEAERIDLAIDGADAVDPNLALIKGGGGAHTVEKVVAASADQFLVVVHDGKLVKRLGGSCPVPVEVLPMAVTPVQRSIEKLGGHPEIRMAVEKDGPVVTDLGNLILDVQFDAIEDPARLEKALNNLPGVLENGLFVGLADRLLVGEMVEGEPAVREYAREGPMPL